jgi:hypothetical protein
MTERLCIITGAPGAGKSATLDALLALRTPYLAFDIDWLAQAASNLARAPILSDPETWQPYRAVWFAVLHAVAMNGHVPVLFAAIDRPDVAAIGPLPWCGGIDWLLLDCSDRVRRARLEERAGWTKAMIEDAIADASALRRDVDTIVDTGTQPPNAVAFAVLAWLDQHRDAPGRCVR